MLYGGRVLTDVERRYAILDNELLAIYDDAVKPNEVYLMGHYLYRPSAVINIKNIY